MASYNWKTFVRGNWWDRFPPWAYGVSAWANQGIMPTPALVEDIARLRLVTPQPSTRLFISHRQNDEDKTLHVAWIADDEGYEFWLDVLDPALTGLASAAASSPQVQGVATTAIIEMGLLNSTHPSPIPKGGFRS